MRITTPSKAWIRSFSPSTTLTCKRSVSPARKGGKSALRLGSSSLVMRLFMIAEPSCVETRTLTNAAARLNAAEAASFPKLKAKDFGAPGHQPMAKLAALKEKKALQGAVLFNLKGTGRTERTKH